MNKKNSILVWIALLFSNFVWGINPTIMKIGLKCMPNMTYNFLRMVIALMVSLIILLFSKTYKRMKIKDLIKVFLIALFAFFLFQIFLVSGVSKTTAGNTSVIMATLPIYVILINYIFRIEKVNKRIVVGILLSIVGVIIIVLGSGGTLTIAKHDMLGILLITLAEVAYAAYSVFSKPLSKKYSNYQIIFTVILFTTVFYAFISIKEITHTEWNSIAIETWSSIIFSGVFAMCIGNIIWVWAINKIGSSKTALSSNLQPVISIISGYFILGESFGMGQIFGAIIVLYGVYITREK